MRPSRPAPFRAFHALPVISRASPWHSRRLSLPDHSGCFPPTFPTFVGRATPQKSKVSEGNSRKCQGEKDASNARQRHVKCQGNALVHARPFVGAFQVRFWSHWSVLGAILWAFIAQNTRSLKRSLKIDVEIPPRMALRGMSRMGV